MLPALLLLAVTLIPMWFLNRWLSRHIQGLGLLLGGSSRAAAMFYFVLMLPGIVLHEISHWAMARLLGLRTGKISLGPRKAGGGKVRLGSVTIARTDFVRESLVGLAPLLFGSACILLIGTLLFDLRGLSQALILRDAGWFLQLLGQGLRAPDFWLWLYLIFSISNAMLPSESDRRAWLPLAVFLALIALPLIVLGWIPTIPQPLLDRWIGWVLYLGTAFSLTLVVDLIFVGLIAGLERVLGLITGSRIRY